MGRRGSILHSPSTMNLICRLPGYNFKRKEKTPVLNFSIFLCNQIPSKEPVRRTSEAGLGQTIWAL
nr:hypothetical protein Iba_scaffold1421CG1100 [Ipomoea batatas]